MPGGLPVHSLPRAGRDIDVGQEVAMKLCMAEDDRAETELLQTLHLEFGELRGHVDRLLRIALDTEQSIDERAGAVAAIRDLARFATALQRLRTE
jgi:hypothetical protein